MTHEPTKMSDAVAWNELEFAGRKFSGTELAAFLLNTAMLIALMLMMAVTGCETAVPA